ncbi:MAG: polyprenyl synthetase family protein [Propionibacteriales bacterium]|nr:polyprenyl synthetase family protein [Propionibacteriales bacterium]
MTDDFRRTIGQLLDAFIDSKQLELAVVGEDLLPLLRIARSTVSGGKRLRPAFAYWGWRAAGGNPAKAEPMLTAAAAIELIHASALVHDDVMDDSATRRGFPAAHREFGRLRQSSVDPEVAARFGRSAAILLGDLLLSWSDELLGSSGLKPKRLTRGRVYFDKLRTEVIAGQYLDVLAQTSRHSTAADAMRVIRYKSAKYTIERPLQFGAAIANADRELLGSLSSYGIPLGEAFQLRDDVLGVFGEQNVTGKPSGDDIREGKRTLLMARAFNKADPRQTEVLRQHLGRRDVDSSGIGAVQDVLRETGALAAVETVISELTSASLLALRDAPIGSGEVRDALRVMTDRVTRRAG